MKDILYKVYNSYLANVAKQEMRGYKPPNSLNSLYERNDNQFFYILEKLLLDNKIEKNSDISEFMSLAFSELKSFHIKHVVDSFAEILEKYKNEKKYNSVEEKIKRIQLTVAFLEEYCIINRINKWSELNSGNPPLILKLWKENKIDELVLVNIFDFDLVNKKTWYKIYCKKISRKIKLLKTEINNNNLLLSVMETEISKITQIITQQ